LLLVAFLLVNAPNCHLYLVLASVVQGDAVNCNSRHSHVFRIRLRSSFKIFKPDQLPDPGILFKLRIPWIQLGIHPCFTYEIMT